MFGLWGDRPIQDFIQYFLRPATADGPLQDKRELMEIFRLGYGLPPELATARDIVLPVLIRTLRRHPVVGTFSRKELLAAKCRFQKGAGQLLSKEELDQAEQWFDELDRKYCATPVEKANTMIDQWIQVAESPRDADAPPWEEVSEQDWEDARMAVYAAQVDRMDQGIGRIMDRLRAEGLEENTLVFFLSDNGGCAELLREDGSRGSVLGETRDGRPVRLGNRRDLMPGGADTFMSYDTPWANASNTPFRLFKHWVHEGGIATPLIAHWPQGFAGGRIVHAPGHVIDIMATCLEAAGAGYPESYGERQITPLEGESLLAACRGADWSRERPIFWEHEGNRAIRTAEWKAVSKYPGEWELYNMIEDRTELVDLAGRDRPRRDAMVRAYEEWAERVEAISWDVQLARMRELRRRH